MFRTRGDVDVLDCLILSIAVVPEREKVKLAPFTGLDAVFLPREPMKHCAHAAVGEYCEAGFCENAPTTEERFDEPNGFGGVSEHEANRIVVDLDSIDK